MPTKKDTSKCGVNTYEMSRAICDFKTCLELFENSEGACEKLFNEKTKGTKGDIMGMRHRIERLEKHVKQIRNQMVCPHDGERTFNQWTGFFSSTRTEKCTECEMVLRHFATMKELIEAEIAYNKGRCAETQKRLTKELAALKENGV